MSEDNVTAGVLKGRLGEAVREVKNRMADQEDAVAELKEAARARLELLAAELEPVFADVPKEMDSFDFAISSGLEPRLWIDAVAHIGLRRDRRTFQFVRDTRSGRVTVAESQGTAPIVEAVTNYIAERIVERERALEGTFAPPGERPDASPPPRGIVETPASPPPRGSGFRSFFAVLVLLVLFGLGLAAVVSWDQFAPWLSARF